MQISPTVVDCLLEQQASVAEFRHWTGWLLFMFAFVYPFTGWLLFCFYGWFHWGCGCTTEVKHWVLLLLQRLAPDGQLAAAMQIDCCFVFTDDFTGVAAVPQRLIIDSKYCCGSLHQMAVGSHHANWLLFLLSLCFYFSQVDCCVSLPYDCLEWWGQGCQ